MSLINQMLQELDARRSEAAAGNGSFGQQVRAVYERNRLHRAWWVGIGLALAVAAGGTGAWYWMRSMPRVSAVPPAPITSAAASAAPAVPAANLPLKFDAGLNHVVQSVPAPVEPLPIDAKPSGVSVAEIPQQDTTAERTKHGTRSASAKMVQGQHSVPVALGDAASRSNEPQAALPDIAKAGPRAGSTMVQDPGKATGEVSPPAIAKHFKELTQQQRAENEYRKGIASLQQGKGSEAVASLEQALQLDPAHASARLALIGILLEKQHKDGAMRRAKEGLMIDVAQPGLAMILARLQLEKGELQPSIETLERTLPYATDRADYQAFLAALLQRAERHKEAVEHYFAALQKTPQNGVWWMGAGISLQADRRKAEAAEAFKRAKASGNLSPALVEFVDAQLAQLQQR